MRPIVKNQSNGIVGHDGNGMVGGRWANTTILAYKDIPVKKLTECISDEEKAEKCLSWLKERRGETFRVEAYFDCGYDHSVGMDSYCEMNEGFDPEDVVFDAIDSCPWLSYGERHEVTGWLYELCEDEDGYELYEIDTEE